MNEVIILLKSIYEVALPPLLLLGALFVGFFMLENYCQKLYEEREEE